MTPELWRAYRQPMADEQMASHFLADVFYEVVSYLPLADSVLCVGCGDGTELAYFRGARGVTLNAKGILPTYRERIVAADMHCLPFATQSFDGLFCKDTFEHALAPTIVFSEFVRVARQWACIIVPDMVWAMSPHHTIIPSPAQLMVMAEKAGWRVKAGSLRVRQPNDCEWTLHMYIMRSPLCPQ